MLRRDGVSGETAGKNGVRMAVHPDAGTERLGSKRPRRQPEQAEVTGVCAGRVQAPLGLCFRDLSIARGWRHTYPRLLPDR